MADLTKQDADQFVGAISTPGFWSQPKDKQRAAVKALPYFKSAPDSAVDQILDSAPPEIRNFKPAPQATQQNTASNGPGEGTRAWAQFSKPLEHWAGNTYDLASHLPVVGKYAGQARDVVRKGEKESDAIINAPGAPTGVVSQTLEALSSTAGSIVPYLAGPGGAAGAGVTGALTAEDQGPAAALKQGVESALFAKFAPAVTGKGVAILSKIPNFKALPETVKRALVTAALGGATGATSGGIPGAVAGAGTFAAMEHIGRNGKTPKGAKESPKTEEPPIPATDGKDHADHPKLVKTLSDAELDKAAEGLDKDAYQRQRLLRQNDIARADMAKNEAKVKEIEAEIDRHVALGKDPSAVPSGKGKGTKARNLQDELAAAQDVVKRQKELIAKNIAKIDQIHATPDLVKLYKDEQAARAAKASGKTTAPPPGAKPVDAKTVVDPNAKPTTTKVSGTPRLFPKLEKGLTVVPKGGVPAKRPEPMPPPQKLLPGTTGTTPPPAPLGTYRARYAAGGPPAKNVNTGTPPNFTMPGDEPGPKAGQNKLTGEIAEQAGFETASGAKGPGSGNAPAKKQITTPARAKAPSGTTQVVSNGGLLPGQRPAFETASGKQGPAVARTTAPPPRKQVEGSTTQAPRAVTGATTSQKLLESPKPTQAPPTNAPPIAAKPKPRTKDQLPPNVPPQRDNSDLPKPPTPEEVAASKAKLEANKAGGPPKTNKLTAQPIGRKVESNGPLKADWRSTPTAWEGAGSEKRDYNANINGHEYKITPTADYESGEDNFTITYTDRSGFTAKEHKVGTSDTLEEAMRDAEEHAMEVHGVEPPKAAEPPAKAANTAAADAHDAATKAFEEAKAKFEAGKIGPRDWAKAKAEYQVAGEEFDEAMANAGNQATPDVSRETPAEETTPKYGKVWKHSDPIPPESEVVNMNTSDINADPERFQYKSEAIGKGGTTDEYYDQDKFDHTKGGEILVWRDPADGKVYVVNGHHRLEIAQRTGHPVMNVRFIQAESAEAARTVGAVTNIADNKGTAIDAAKIFRDGNMSEEELKQNGLTSKKALVRQGMALAKLSPKLFKKVVNEELTADRGAVIGEMIPDNPAEQEAAVNYIEQAEKRGKRFNNGELRELIGFVQNAPTAVQRTEDLFGFDEVQRSYAAEKAQLSDAVRRSLSTEKRLLGSVGKESAANTLGKAGNQINVAGSAEGSKQAGQILETYDKLKMLSGPIGDALTEGAEEMAKGAKFNDAYNRIYAKIRDFVSKRNGGNPK